MIIFGLANANNDYLKQKIVLRAHGIFNLKCLLVEFVIPNILVRFFCIPENFKTNVSNRGLSKKSPI